jgi:hypothetical protein
VLAAEFVLIERWVAARGGPSSLPAEWGAGGP